jgi:hypothetical protein
MEVSGHHYHSPGKEHWYPLNKRRGGPPSRMDVSECKVLPPPPPVGNKTAKCSAFSIVTILTELSRFYKRKSPNCLRPGVEVASWWLKGIRSEIVISRVTSPVLSLHCLCGYFMNHFHLIGNIKLCGYIAIYTQECYDFDDMPYIVFWTRTCVLLKDYAVPRIILELYSKSASRPVINVLNPETK